MLKKIENIITRAVSFDSSLKILRVGMLLLPAVCLLLVSSCDTCVQNSGDGKDKENTIYFTSLPVNGVLPNIYEIDDKGGGMKGIISNAIMFSSPSSNGRIAFVRKDTSTGFNSLYAANIDGSNISLVASDNDIFSITYPVISPDGKKVVFNGGNRKLFINDPIGSGIFNQISNKMASGCIPVFSHDSKYMAFFEGDESAGLTLKVIDAVNVDVVTTVYSLSLKDMETIENGELKADWALNSNILAFSMKKGSDDIVHIIEVGNNVARTLPIPNAEIGGNQPALSPKGDFLAVSGRDGNIWVIFIATDDLKFSKITSADGFETNTSARWSHSGNGIIYNSATVFDSGIYSTLISAELRFEITLARLHKAYVLSNNSYKGFWNVNL